MQPAKKISVKSEAVKQKSTSLTAQLLWVAHSWNATPEEAAQQIVADLFEHLSRGGTVQVHLAELDGTAYMLDVAVER